MRKGPLPHPAAPVFLFSAHTEKAATQGFQAEKKWLQNTQSAVFLITGIKIQSIKQTLFNQNSKTFTYEENLYSSFNGTPGSGS